MADNIEDVLDLSHNLAEVTAELSQQIKMIDFKAVAELPPLEQAQYYSKLAYVTSSAMFAFILASGADPKTHPIMKDLDTVKTYMGKVAKAEGKPDFRKDERKTKVDIPAAKRIIFAQTDAKERAISSDSVKEPETTSEAAEAFLKDVTKSTKGKKDKKDKKDKKKVVKPKKGKKDWCIGCIL